MCVQILEKSNLSESQLNNSLVLSFHLIFNHYHIKSGKDQLNFAAQSNS